jgi:hypothetical protein
MSRFDGSLARTLDFGDEAAVPARYARRRTGGLSSLDPRVAALRVRPSRLLGLLRGPDKYTVFDRRRRAAQIKARHAMDLIDVIERAGERS